MSAIQVHPLSPLVATHVRTSMRSPQYGHPAHREVASGTGPCRSCLAPFSVGAEERLLFTYDPFERLDPVPLPGPIFIHAAACVSHDGPGFPTPLHSIPLIAEAYRAGRECSARVRLAFGAEEATLATLLEDRTVQYIHLRHAEAGCYIARVESIVPPDRVTEAPDRSRPTARRSN